LKPNIIFIGTGDGR